MSKNETATPVEATVDVNAAKEEIKQKQAALKEQLALLKEQEKALKKSGTARKPAIKPIVEQMLKEDSTLTLDAVFRRIITEHPDYSVQTVVSSGRKAYMAITKPTAE